MLGLQIVGREMLIMNSTDAFTLAVREHDRAVRERGLNLWVGSEPTFTDRYSQAPEWLSSALGGEKEARAHELAKELATHMSGAMILRSTGRLYPGESRPRWNIGLYRRTDGAPFWQGPPDPLLCEEALPASPDLDIWVAALAEALTEAGWPVDTEDDAEVDNSRDTELEIDADTDKRELVVRGEGESEKLRFALSIATVTTDSVSARLGLPALDSMPRCHKVLDAVARSARNAGLSTLIIAGDAPPTDENFELTTITPDPAVIEINSAPNASAEQFLWRSRRIYDSASTVGLTPYRLYFNGAVADSGGGGHITLGGPSPHTSPFILQPQLVLRLVRFFNHHPALSYLFAHDFVGGSGISVRPDERGIDAFDELVLELDLLANCPELTPDLVWQGLAPFLCDVAGNSHRSEINIEKLWNPFLKGRGRLGLVEFRALRMPQSTERATALACLLRAIVAMLSAVPYDKPLIDWGRALHDRHALPFYLEQDLQQVFDALAVAGLGLGKPIEQVLRTDKFRLMAKVRLPGYVLELRRAMEFWPLLGDVTSEEQGGSSRLIDSSTARVELRLRPAPLKEGQEMAASGAWPEIAISSGNLPLPMRLERDYLGELKVYGLRYRRFPPTQGLHPMLGAQAPVIFRASYPGEACDFVITLHEWEPRGEAYPGLPEDLDDAEMRRSERVTVSKVDRDSSVERATTELPEACRGVGDYCVDIRFLSVS